MSALDNALAILRFGSPERVVQLIPAYGICYHGCNHEGHAGGGHDCPAGTEWTDIWGTTWHKELPDVMGFPRGNPLSEVEALATYQWPDPDDERICGKIYRMAEDYPGDDRLLTGSHRDTLWEKAYMLVGMEHMMMAFYSEPEFAREVLHRIMDFQLGIARHYVKVGIRQAGLGDDLGTQQGPLLSPAIVEEFLLPEYRRLFDFYREHQVIINFHSCGNIAGMLDYFMDLGVDILNPVQANANDLDLIRAKTQGRMALQGAVSTSTILNGPPARIEAEVRERLWQLGRAGGYFCSADQWMPFPQAHIDALNRAIEEHGVYPLCPPHD